VKRQRTVIPLTSCFGASSLKSTLLRRSAISPWLPATFRGGLGRGSKSPPSPTAALLCDHAVLVYLPARKPSPSLFAHLPCLTRVKIPRENRWGKPPASYRREAFLHRALRGISKTGHSCDRQEKWRLSRTRTAIVEIGKLTVSPTEPSVSKALPLCAPLYLCVSNFFAPGASYRGPFEQCPQPAVHFRCKLRHTLRLRSLTKAEPVSILPAKQ